MSGNEWEKLQRNMLKEASLVIGRDFVKHREELGEVTKNQLFDTGGPIVIDKKQTKDEKYFGRIFYSYIEIDSSVRALRDIEIYISSFPYKNKSITKPRYLRYHIESYFNEVYVLKKRLNAYLTVVGRLFKGDPRHSQILTTTKPVFQIIKNALEGLIITRGKHVHKSRFSHLDLDRLETMELLVSNGTTDLAAYYEIEYKRLRKKWKETIKNNNDATIELLNIYAKVITLSIFNTSGRLKYPRLKKLHKKAPKPKK